MKKLRYSSKAKKDLKKFQNNPQKLRLLYEVLNLLVNDLELPKEYSPHKLIGNYKGCMECHIGGDFLLIWYDEENNTIEIVRIGSHSDLFK